MESIDCVVIGAGVVGLAVARAIAMRGVETIVLERNSGAGQETSSRNSGVIHSGIYYPTGSLKARLCVRGRDLLYEYAEKRGVLHRRCGKLIVAQVHQLEALRKLAERALANGVTDLEQLNARQVHELEPAVTCAAALLSPSTGIVDVHELLTNLIADLEAAGGALVLHTSVETAAVGREGIVLSVRSVDDESEILAKRVINAAGLSANDFLRAIRGYPQDRLRATYYAKGSYFACRGVRPFNRLVYPMPSEAGLGVHATLDLDGTTRFGPDVEWVDEPEYSVDPSRAEQFYGAIREYWPGLPDGALQPAYAGVRPKLVGPGSPAGDFVIEDDSVHGIRGLVSLLGIESPGLTSSLAIGEEIAKRVAN